MSNIPISVLYNSIQKCLQLRQNLKLPVVEEVLRHVELYLKEPESLEFLRSTGARIIEEILFSSSLRLSFEEKQSIEKILLKFTDLVDLLTKQEDLLCIELIAELVDKSHPFYHEVVYDTPTIRNKLLKKISTLDLYSRMTQLWSTQLGRWPGALYLQKLLRVMPSPALEEFVSVLMKSLDSQTDETLKRETSVTISNLFDCLRDISTKRSGSFGFMTVDETFQTFWLSFISKLLLSSSIVLRLYGWDLLQSMLSFANRIRPWPRCYNVSGAGTLFVNGTYSYARSVSQTDQQYPCYERLPEISGENKISLLRCQMRSYNKYRCLYKWFLSFAHPSQPGGPQDIDYYDCDGENEHNSLPSDFPNHWTRCRSGSDPLPKVRKVGFLSESPCLTSRVIDWVQSEDLISLVFCSSMHREILGRSESLLQFLATEDAFSDEIMDKIWETISTLALDETLEEAIAVIARVSQLLDNNKIVAMLRTVECVAARNESDRVKVAIFLEKFNAATICSLDQECTNIILNILWANYGKNNSFRVLKNGAFLESIMSSYLQSPFGQEFRMSKAQDALVSLLDLQMESSSKQNVEIIASTAISCLNIVMIGSLSKQLLTLDLNPVKILTNELNRSLNVLSKASSPSLEHISNVLRVIATVFLQSSIVSIDDLRIVKDALLQHEVCIDIYFTFLEQLIGDNMKHRAAKEEILTTVFQEFICAANVNFSVFGSSAFRCFRKYYKESGLDRYQPIDKDELLGHAQSFIWKVILEVSSDDEVSNAIEVFIETSSLTSEDRVTVFLSQISEKLSTVQNFENNLIGRRCIMVLNEVLKHNNIFNNWEMPHGLCGTRVRIAVRTIHREMESSGLYYDMFPVPNTKGETTLYISPLASIMEFKVLVCRELKFPNPKNVKVSLSLKNHLQNNNVRLYQLLKSDQLTLYVDYERNRTKFLDESNFLDVARFVEDAEGLFDYLLSAAESSDKIISNLAWQCINLIPTLQSFLDLCWMNSVEFDSVSPGRAVYFLEIYDNIIQPSHHSIYRKNEYERNQFRLQFVTSGNLAKVVEKFVTTPFANDNTHLSILKVGLHLLKFYSSSNVNIDQEDEQQQQLQKDMEHSLHELFTKSALPISEKLLALAGKCSDSGEFGIVQDALTTIQSLMKYSDIAETLAHVPQAKGLLMTVLCSSSSASRQMGELFAVSIGKRACEVVDWLLQTIYTLNHCDVNCGELFHATNALIEFWSIKSKDMLSLSGLSSHISKSLPELLISQPSGNNVHVLLGLLQLTNCVLEHDTVTFLGTKVGRELPVIIFDKVLFDFSSSGSNSCNDNNNIRQICFTILKSYCTKDAATFQQLTQKQRSLHQLASNKLNNNWNVSLLREVKRPNVEYLGLKNQGLTCYMNSLLQQLFRNEKFREHVLKTPLLEYHRNSMWHLTNEELVGRSCELITPNNRPIQCKILGYENGSFKVQFLPQEQIANISDIREKNFRLIPTPNSDDERNMEKLSEKDEAAIRVLEQLQRTFCYLKYSNKRYFDPKPLVDACRSLNMNFDVYQQNDAAEFFDSILDRVEIVTKGKYSKVDVWTDAIKKDVFGGTYLYQKLPKECDAFNQDRNSCGHWKSTREESFLRVELNIRGLESMEDAMESNFKSEIMDGENKISCEECGKKQTTERRTCIGNAPNMLTVHLKRFDLDFSTFETVKLNTRVSFPMKFNVFKYTKEGLELKDAKERGEIIDESGIDMSAFDYVLQGIVIHAGIAQGGHYYSYIKGSGDDDSWYLFDDDSVSPFDKDTIPFHCFGGPMSAFAGQPGVTAKQIEMDAERTANALLLFYVKANRQSTSSLSEPSTTANIVVDSSNSVGRLVTGEQAYLPEVQQNNFNHRVSSSVFDNDYSNYLLALADWSVTSNRFNFDMFNLVYAYFTSIFLRSRDRVGTENWIKLFQKIFAHDKECAKLALKLVLMKKNEWFLNTFLGCKDVFARKYLTQFVVAALNCVAPTDLSTATKDDNSNLCTTLIDIMLQVLFDFPTLSALLNRQNADDYIALFRDVATIPFCCKELNLRDAITHLLHFFQPNEDSQFFKKSQTRQDYTALYPSIVEAVSSLLGVPQLREANLIVESHSYHKELTKEATSAFTSIFNEISKNGILTYASLLAYFDSIGSARPDQYTLSLFFKPGQQVSLESFLEYYSERAILSPKELWSALRAHGFRNDLSRTNWNNSNSNSVAIGSISSHSIEELGVDKRVRVKLCNFEIVSMFYYWNQDVSKSILRRLASTNDQYPKLIYVTILRRLLSVVNTKNFDDLFKICLDIICCVLNSLDHASMARTVVEDITGIDKQSSIISAMLADHNQKFVVDRLSLLLYCICDRVPWLFDKLIEKNENNGFPDAIRGKLRLTRGSTLCLEDIDILSQTLLLVRGSRDFDISGYYKFCGIENNAGMFRKDNGDFSFIIRKIANHCYEWQLTMIDSSEVLYSKISNEKEILPPKIMESYRMLEKITIECKSVLDLQENDDVAEDDFDDSFYSEQQMEAQHDSRYESSCESDSDLGDATSENSV